ncbi:MAG: hypothetical protein ACI8T1_001820 [Verrucomicrobiales bacterium]|jgi:hypothetical protein
MDVIPENFEFLGSYSIPDAKRLLEALEAADVLVEAEFDDGMGNGEYAASFGGFGGNASVEIAVETARRSDVEIIQTRLFGANLPNLPEGYKIHGADEFHLRQHRETLILELGELGDRLSSALSEGRAAEDLVAASQGLKEQIAEIDQALKA